MKKMKLALAMVPVVVLAGCGLKTITIKLDEGDLKIGGTLQLQSEAVQIPQLSKTVNLEVLGRAECAQKYGGDSSQWDFLPDKVTYIQSVDVPATGTVEGTCEKS